MMPLEIPPPGAIENVRFESERELFRELSARPRIARAADQLRKSNVEDAHRRSLLANSLRITDHIIPELCERIEFAKRVAHLESKNVETFIYNDPKQAASCLCFGQNVFLLISSGLYSKLTERELLFIIGHELGHVVYDHHRLPARAILSQKGACDAEHALKLMAWSRRAEISADRVGLLCCQDLEAAARSFIKISSGLSEELADFDLMGYVSQVHDLEAVARSVRAVDDLYSTHPFNPIRIVALYRHWQSATCRRLLGHPPLDVGPIPNGQSDEEADARIHELLQYMDPDLNTLGTRNVDECLVWGGLWVAASNGRIDQTVAQTISRSVNSPVAGEALATIQKHAEPFSIIRERFDRAAMGCNGLPPVQRHAIVQQMIAVARADAHIAANERNTLQQICIALELSPSFADRILDQYSQVQSVDSVFAQVF